MIKLMLITQFIVINKLLGRNFFFKYNYNFLYKYIIMLLCTLTSLYLFWLGH